MIATFTNIKSQFDSTCERGGSFLDHNPNLYKTALLVSHISRAIMMYTAFSLSPIFACTILVPISLLYRVSVERFCCFRFTMPSLFGGIALYLVEKSMLGYIPLTAYSILACSIVNNDINTYMARPKNGCCATSS